MEVAESPKGGEGFEGSKAAGGRNPRTDRPRPGLWLGRGHAQIIGIKQWKWSNWHTN